RYMEAVTFCTSYPSKPCYGVGDLNGRIASKSPANSPLERVSQDARTTPRGNRLLHLWETCSASVLNGTSYDIDGCAQLTSIQGMGNSVIDYIWASNSGVG
ncbi:hypothetical protein B0H12DRAFT_1002965, partial [Mycena haematopus]